MRNVVLFVSLTLVLMMVFAGYASAANVYFFQSKTAGDYTLSGGYSVFKNKLVESGYEVNELRLGLSTDSLSKVTPAPDILVIPNLGSDLSADESTALFEFVMKNGKSVLLCGATASTNKLTIPLGMRVSDDLLEDDVDVIRDLSTDKLVSDKTSFYIDLPSDRPDTVINALTRGVTKVDVFSSGGIYLFGNSKGVIFGGDAVNTPKALTFQKGDKPPVAAYAQLGKGWVFLLTDPDMLSNKNLDTAKYRHDNLKFSLNVVDWLSQPANEVVSEDEIDSIIRFQRAQITELNRTISDKEKEKADLDNRLLQIDDEKEALVQEVANLKRNSFLGIKYEIWAIGVLALCFLLTAGVVLKKGKKEVKAVEKGDLGYEFNEKEFGIGASNAEKSADNKIKEEDIEERLKELQRGSQ
jgi:hypothetical protein